METSQEGLSEQRWGAALTASSVIAWSYALSGLDLQTYAVIALPMIAVYLLCWLGWWIGRWRAAQKEKPPEPKAGSLQELIMLIDKYCAQGGARQLQHPWLLASLYSYILGFSLLVYTLADGDAACLSVTVAALFAIWCMSMVGNFAEENPPTLGKEPVLRALKGYRAQNRAEHQSLIWKIYRGDWIMEDLVAFAAAEEQEIGRSYVLEQQNKIFRD